MGMTYAALAKSLGISLKSSASATTTHTSSVLPSTSIPADDPKHSSGNAHKEDTKGTPLSPTITGTSQEKDDGEKRMDVEPISERRTAPLTDADADMKGTGDTEQISRVNSSPTGTAKSSDSGAMTEEEGVDAGAEGASDSDIASSRPSSPNLASAMEHSPQENSSEKADSKFIKSTNESQSAHNAADLGAGSPPKTSTVPRSAPREPMTDEQLHQAKVLVLDLLGWGVPPEYLLQRGVSHALLYTVFTDLRLRLPDAIFEDCVKLVSAQS